VTPELISALKNPKAYPHPTKAIRILETHISWIVLTGDIAYKIKKPVNFGFLDFTSLAQRKQYCEAELSLNSRSAPELYLGLVAITGSAQAPRIGTGNECDDTVIEYAIRMNQFESGQLFTELHTAGALHMEHIDELAEKVSHFHASVAAAEPDSSFGEPEQVFAPMQQNFEQIRMLIEKNGLPLDDSQHQQLNQIEAWTRETCVRLSPLLEQRKQQGFVRDCHGDMHMGNLTLYHGRVTLFDCIEFNDDFRWIDVISDIAFLVMDFEDKNLHQFANRFLNIYLERSGDYAGLRLLSFYKAYRAVVRAKIALFTLDGTTCNNSYRDACFDDFTRYMTLAEQCSNLPNRMVLTMHGVSGTGKSTVALRLVDRLGLIRIRSDVERKRLFGIPPQVHPEGEVLDQLYSPDATQKTYATLARLCAHILDAGLSVVVDATNLKHWQRQTLEDVAVNRGVPVCIAYCQASMSVIKDWIKKRKRDEDDASDADLAIVDRQIQRREPLNDEELQQCFVIHSNIIEETNELVAEIRKRFL